MLPTRPFYIGSRPLARVRQKAQQAIEFAGPCEDSVAGSQVPIGEIWIGPKSRDDIPAVLKGLQHLWCDEELRGRLFALLDEQVLPGTDRKVGRRGMELWRILVLGVLKQGLGCDFDRLQELANQHATVRAFLGHGEFGDKSYYEYQTVVDNVCLLTPDRRTGSWRSPSSTRQRDPAPPLNRWPPAVPGGRS